MTRIRIVVADDQEIVRAGFSALLATQPDFAVVGVATNGVEAYASAANSARMSS